MAMSGEDRRAERLSLIQSIVLSDEELGAVSGNAPFFLKQAAVRWYKLLGMPAPTFCAAPREHARVTEVSLETSVDDPERVNTKMVTELDITQAMCNELGQLSQGCMTALVDEGSAIALLLMKLLQGGEEKIGVSQTLNMIFYQPVPLVGEKIMLVSRSVSTEEDSGCCSCEIWDVARRRLVVSGKQIQMTPSR